MFVRLVSNQVQYCIFKMKTGNKSSLGNIPAGTCVTGFMSASGLNVSQLRRLARQDLGDTHLAPVLEFVSYCLLIVITMM